MELFGYDDNKAIEIVVITKVTGLMKVLFAEDDHKVGNHVKDALTAEGYAVKWVEDGSCSTSCCLSETGSASFGTSWSHLR